ncbi:TrkH-domain-containing protein [Mycena filopes]|nr:TrkH-domain-containing protein [Mycena filopes]
MADLKKPAPPKGFFAAVSDLVWSHGTFYRLHLAAFTFIPIISAAVFYACNGRYHVSFLDSLLLCYSAMTVCGLSTVNLSTTTPLQQVILYLLMLIGNVTVVSWIVSLFFLSRKSYLKLGFKMVLVRKWYFKNVCQYVDYQLTHRHPSKSGEMFSKSISSPVAMFKQTEEVPMPEKPTFEIIQPTPAATVRAGMPIPRRTSTAYSSTRKTEPENTKYQGKGGFPGPVTLAKKLFKRGAPTTFRRLERKMTMPYTETLTAKETPWLSFDGLVVGRNSAFRTESLSDEQVEFIGGVEYRALRFLSYLIPAYFVGTQLFTFILFAPWLSVTKQYDAVFAAQPRLVQKPWYSLFVILGAYSGAGLSLVDLGMIPFQSAYLLIFGLMFVILAGNHALPIFLRFTIWAWYKTVPAESEMGKTLSFLLQHPRRFPSHQTWFLVICLVAFSTVEWVAFEVLDIGLPFFKAMERGPRVVDGLFQGLAVRASGLEIVPLASASPALQFLYVVMMYIAVYPVAMTIRSTNVYESESLGVFEEPPPDEDEEPTNLESYEPRERVGRYLLWHLHREMSIGKWIVDQTSLVLTPSSDIWWLVWGVFVVAVIERHSLSDEDKNWFDLFRIMFELVSAFGGIGLSLGFPDDNYSFSGALGPWSKLVIIVIMVRGRHRGLPVGIERAVTLPTELNTEGGKKAPVDSHPTNGDDTTDVAA